jgi:cytochrome c biogenesis protein CcmG/thiol:disulfide interchange protein DsbE
MVHNVEPMHAVRRTGQGLALCAVLGLLGLLVWRLTHQSEPPKIGKPAPQFALRRIGGAGKVALADLRGKAVVINFWASDCIPCAREAATLEALYGRYRARGLVVLGVDTDDFASDAARFLARHRVTYPNVRDGDGTVAGRYAVFGTPETFVLDREGRMVGDTILGPVTLDANRSLLARSLRVALG